MDTSDRPVPTPTPTLSLVLFGKGEISSCNERNDNFQFYIGIECKVRNLNLIKLQVMMKTEEVSPV